MPDRHLQLRIPAGLSTSLRDAIERPSPMGESVVFGLIASAETESRSLLLLREVVVLAESDYIADRRHGAKWSGRSMLPMLNRALEKRLGVLILHSHGSSDPVSLSDDDLHSARNLLPRFQNLMPGRPHGSIVFGHSTAAGLILTTSGYSSSLTVRLTEPILQEIDGGLESVPRAIQPDVMRHRQRLLIGGAGDEALRRATVVVVGLSGGGSHVVQQLAHLGVGNLIGIDADRADETNRGRLIGMTRLDAILKRRKTAIARRNVRRIDRRIHFTSVTANVPEEAAIAALKRADIIVSCVDSLHSRADIHELALRYLIPHIDIGLLIRPIKEGGGISIGGQVITAIPGRFCLWCCGLLSHQKLLAETGGRPRTYFEGTDKQAQVVSMNGVLASQAVSEVLQILTGFAPVDLEEKCFKKYDGLSGTLMEWEVKPNPACSMCRAVLGSGDPVWDEG
jgi:molybdopterin/thiamine biosynthesis adenylyltransferase